MRPESAPGLSVCLPVCSASNISLQGPLSLCLLSRSGSPGLRCCLPLHLPERVLPLSLPPVQGPGCAFSPGTTPEARPAFHVVANQPQLSSWEGSTLNLTSLPQPEFLCSCLGLRSGRCAYSSHRPSSGHGPATPGPDGWALLEAASLAV